MGDYRYKINGSAEPYTIKLYNSNDTEITSFCGNNTYYDDYVCGFISNLNPGTYYICTTDNIGTSAKGPNFTIPDDYDFYVPPKVEFSLSTYTTNGDDPKICYVEGDRCLVISPDLETNQNADVTFTLSGKGDGASVYGCVYIACNNAVNSQWEFCANNTTPSSKDVIINVKPNDNVIYYICAYNDPPHDGNTYTSTAGLELKTIESKGTEPINWEITDPSTISVTNERTEADDNIIVSLTESSNGEYNEWCRITYDIELSSPIPTNEYIDVEYKIWDIINYIGATQLYACNDFWWDDGNDGDLIASYDDTNNQPIHDVLRLNPGCIYTIDNYLGREDATSLEYTSVCAEIVGVTGSTNIANKVYVDDTYDNYYECLTGDQYVAALCYCINDTNPAGPSADGEINIYCSPEADTAYLTSTEKVDVRVGVSIDIGDVQGSGSAASAAAIIYCNGEYLPGGYIECSEAGFYDSKEVTITLNGNDSYDFDLNISKNESDYAISEIYILGVTGYSSYSGNVDYIYDDYDIPNDVYSLSDDVMIEF